MRPVRFRLIFALTLLTTAVAWFGRAPDQAMAAPPQISCAEAGNTDISDVDVTEVVLCDDFENATAADFVRCGDFFGFGDRCALRSSAQLPFSPLTDVYVRWYQYISGQEDAAQPDRSVTLTDASGTIRVSSVSESSDAVSLFLDPGKWYVFEWHVKLNSPGMDDGISELWIDDTTLPRAKTLRMSRTDMQWLSTEQADTALAVLQFTCGTAKRPCSDPRSRSISGDGIAWSSPGFRSARSKVCVPPRRPWGCASATSQPANPQLDGRPGRSRSPR